MLHFVVRETFHFVTDSTRLPRHPENALDTSVQSLSVDNVIGEENNVRLSEVSVFFAATRNLI